MMAAWLQREISGRALRCRPGSGKRIYLGVMPACAFMPAAANDLVVAHQHAAHAGIRACAIQPFFSKPQSLGHKAVIG